MKTIIIANPKGGSGKSTISIQIASGLTSYGYRTQVLDIDSPQFTSHTFFENRSKLGDVEINNMEFHKIETISELSTHIEKTKQYYDILIIDTPGHMNEIFREAHKYADLLVTPMNDSLFDFDVLMHVRDGKLTNELGFYGHFIWELRKHMALEGKNLKWLLLRNRLNPLFTKNKLKVTTLVQGLSKKLGFKINEGLLDRVSYKASFEKGTTLLDKLSSKLTPSEFAARQEVRNLLNDVCEMLELSNN